jgi:hypothetical protein
MRLQKGNKIRVPSDHRELPKHQERQTYAYIISFQCSEE